MNGQPLEEQSTPLGMAIQSVITVKSILLISNGIMLLNLSTILMKGNMEPSTG
jgi:hypothetical protein